MSNPVYHIYLDFIDRNEANNAYMFLKDNKSILSIRTETSGGNKLIEVKVVFTENGKPYSYLAKRHVEVGKKVVVATSDGLEIVTVVDCGETTKEALASKLDIKRYRYIVAVCE